MIPIVLFFLCVCVNLFEKRLVTHTHTYLNWIEASNQKPFFVSSFSYRTFNDNNDEHANWIFLEFETFFFYFFSFCLLNNNNKFICESTDFHFLFFFYIQNNVEKVSKNNNNNNFVIVLVVSLVIRFSLCFFLFFGCFQK